MAKCYYAKHKLVWEILEGGLKSKIEIQWSDIMALKANCPDDGPATLNLVVLTSSLFMDINLWIFLTATLCLMLCLLVSAAG